MPHHFIQMEDLTTRTTRVAVLSDAEMIGAYSPGHRELLARGLPIQLGYQIHHDMQAFTNLHRTLPEAMTRPPLPVNLAARRAGVPQLKRA